eukprot:4040409-Pleurochrysis_carterae.AAC.1
MDEARAARGLASPDSASIYPADSAQYHPYIVLRLCGLDQSHLNGRHASTAHRTGVGLMNPCVLTVDPQDARIAPHLSASNGALLVGLLLAAMTSAVYQHL